MQVFSIHSDFPVLQQYSIVFFPSCFNFPPNYGIVSLALGGVASSASICGRASRSEATFDFGSGGGVASECQSACSLEREAHASLLTWILLPHETHDLRGTSLPSLA